CQHIIYSSTLLSHHDSHYIHSFPTRRSSDLNPGGLLNEAVDMINFFVNKGKLVLYLENKFGDREKVIAENDQIIREDDFDNIYIDRKSTRLNSSHVSISYAVFCLKKKITKKK